jgi:outer membrane protein TolC
LLACAAVFCGLQHRHAAADERAASTRRSTRLIGAAMRKDVEPIKGPLTLDEAMARALKYNLDRRARLMEEALALNQLDVSQLDMLPKLMAQAGYASRSVERATFSSPVHPVWPNRIQLVQLSAEPTTTPWTWA